VTGGETNSGIGQGKESESDDIRKGRMIWKAFGKEEGIRIRTLFYCSKGSM
jgi:hypothetical protein